MTVIVVAGIEPGAGATTVAAGLAHRIAYAGHAVRVERLGGDERAGNDATAFAGLEFASSSGSPIEPAAAADGDGMTVVEAPAGADAAALARELSAKLVIVGPPGSAASGGATLVTSHALSAGPLRLPEDRLLAGPTVGALIAASRAQVLARSSAGEQQVCEHIVIGPVAADPSEPHFERFPRAAVVTRAEKVDIALAAMRTDTVCLILSGGADPSPYLLDYVAASRTTTLLVAPEGTVETVRDIEGTFGSSPFAGEEKAERAGELLAAALDDEALAALIG